MQRNLLLASAVAVGIMLTACDGNSPRFADPADPPAVPPTDPMDPPMEQVILRDLVLNEINMRTRADTLPVPVNGLDFVVDDMQIDLDLVNAM